MPSFKIELVEPQMQQSIKSAKIEFIGQKPKNKIEAGELSIEKWKLIVEYLDRNILLYPVKAGQPSNDAELCGYCMIYLIPKDSCDGCPIQKRTQVSQCNETPYEAYANLKFYCNSRIVDQSDIEALRIAAQQEVAMLEEIQATLKGNNYAERSTDRG